jgi:type III secretion protein V
MGLDSARSGIREVTLPLLTIMVVAMIIFPLPAWMLDILLAANIAFCIILLLSSLFISEPDRFTSLPTLLLLSTLFRLGLNISSTRLILSGVQIPDVIVAFGNFVVAGSTIVGLVVFSIISIIQFIVIAKGSERVAEVAARFTLDALPGKQMSIDADMRAGLLGMAEAREKRRELHRESKLYGALDGAMKFIKGDAIVGLCIIFVNIIAGFIVGVTRDGLSFSDAVTQYTLFTIGDGLVSQIPAVLVSVAAGIVVTRVSDHEGGMLSEEIGGQLCNEPKVLLISSMVLFVLGLVPGLPFLPFLGISAIPAVYWWGGRARAMSPSSSNQQLAYQFSPKILPPLVLNVSAQGALLLQQEEAISQYIEAIRAELFDSSGVLLPDVCFDIDPHQTMVSAELLVYSQSKGIVLFDPSLSAHAEEKDPWSRLVGQFLKSQVSACVTDFVNDAHTRKLLDMYEPYHLDLINTLLPEKMNVTFLTLIIRDIVHEGVSVRDFYNVLQALSEHFYFTEHRDVPLPLSGVLAEAVRAVRRSLIPKWIEKNYSKDEPLEVYVLDRELEEKLLMHCEADIKLHPEMSEHVVSEAERVCGNKKGRTKQILLVHPVIRAALRSVLESYTASMHVLSYEEIPGNYEISVQSRFGIKESELYEEAA